MSKSRKLKGMSKEDEYALAVLIDEKHSATQVMKELKAANDIGKKYNTIRSFRNRICKQIRELKDSCANPKTLPSTT